MSTLILQLLWANPMCFLLPAHPIACNTMSIASASACWDVDGPVDIVADHVQ